MRLIDADLFPKFHVCCGETEHQIGFDEGIEYMLDEIHDAPTVNAILVNHGRWVKATGYMPSEYFGRHMCSVCEHLLQTIYQMENGYLQYVHHAEQ